LKLRFLLDTHVVLALADVKFANPPQWVLDAALKPANELFVSVVSIWEVAIKHRLGKLPLPCPLAHWPDLLAAARMKILALEVDPVLVDLEPMPDTRDPFDRLLLAVAQSRGMRLLTIDRALLEHPLAWGPA
jgi:PIN domain nuclease of toxin-antitoxin system